MTWLGRFVLLAYPRTGSTWARYIIEHCTGYAAANPGPAKDNYAFRDAGEPITHLSDPDARPLVTKVHRLSELPELQRMVGPMVLLVRDPFEVIAGFMFGELRRWATVEEFCQCLPNAEYDRRAEWYFENVAEACRISAAGAPALVVYYEDLVARPSETIAELVEFLGYSGSSEAFMTDHESHKAKCLGYKIGEQASGGCLVNTRGSLAPMFRPYLPVSVKQVLWRTTKQFQILERYL